MHSPVMLSFTSGRSFISRLMVRSLKLTNVSVSCFARPAAPNRTNFSTTVATHDLVKVNVAEVKVTGWSMAVDGTDVCEVK